MHANPQPRPLGPRAPTSAGSLPQPAGTTPPLVIRRPTRPTLALPSSSGRSPSPGLSLSIPGARSRPATPAMRIEIPTGGSGASEGGGYYTGGPAESVVNSRPDTDDLTLRPDSTTTAAPPGRHEPLADIRDLIDSLPNPSGSLPGSDAEDTDPEVIHAASSAPRLSWSDSVLEEISRLGEGASGAVHKVKDKRTGKVLARKTITTREAPVKQLLNELSIFSTAEHVNIIPFYGAYMSPSSSEVKILMEFCEGGSLEAVGRRLKDMNAVVGEKIVGRLAEGVLQGLAYLHLKKTIHRDIKPSNILLSREGVVKLCDFGVSGFLVGSLAGTFTGTSFYMAPERIVGQKYSIRSDVWSTGISLLELVQNRFPFPPDLPPIELMMYITAGEPPRLEDEGDLVWSDDMKDFIKQTLTVDGQVRPTPKEMLEHPWIVNAMKQEVQMARWIRKVWGWPKTHSSGERRRSGDYVRRDSHDSHGPNSESPPQS